MVLHRRRLHRIEHPGHARYLTCSCYQRLPLLGNDRIKDALAAQLELTHRELRFNLFAWVLMPEHFHLLIQTGQPTLSVGDILRRLKMRFARRVLTRWQELHAPILPRLRDKQGRFRFWQPGGGYDRNITSEHELSEKVDYLHNNPVRRGLTDDPTTWRWSSARWYAGDKSSVVRIDPLH
ncbi:MAG: transposase [Phycisphaeraceae bacterium]|nr:transposase [Phycisphaeraceae bacterium]